MKVFSYEIAGGGDAPLAAAAGNSRAHNLYIIVQSVWSRIYGPCFMIYGLWFIPYGLWCMVYGLWFRVHGLEFMVHGSWFMVYVLWFMDYGFRFMIDVLCFRVCGLGLRVKPKIAVPSPE